MASSEEQKPSRSGLGWFPKLILWGAVIAFGYVYLSSVDREGGGTTASSLLDSVAKLSPISLSSIPGFSDQEEGAAEPVEVAKTEEAPPAETAKPVAQTESAAFTRALVSDQTEVSKAAPPPPATYAAVAMKPASEPAPAPAEKTAPAPVEKAAPAQVAEAPSAQPSRLQMSAPVASQPAPVAPAPAMPAPVESAPAAGMSANDWAAMRQQQRAEMMAQYEAMRREADQRMRQYWEQRREAMPMAAPYGYPGYAPGYMPGYAPGYAPGVYGPPR
ncbi:hypothetical protein [Allochromatium palmeri]|uniref:Uncharacterized protein n=1 Tax=Allochromatium palmeri TaxID=231048 RepID=A0A6N8EGM8_9GAMM|nr:hypothetical protein [Allochromatium palmeri]MTW21524.1 hypothetical protein [Allochromatium palmeri]